MTLDIHPGQAEEKRRFTANPRQGIEALRREEHKEDKKKNLEKKKL